MKLREMVLIPFPARSILISILAPSRFDVLEPSFLQAAGNGPVLESDWIDIDYNCWHSVGESFRR